LEAGEICDHGEKGAFPGFNKRIHCQGKCPNGSVVGVYLKENEYWVASVQVMTPFASTSSKSCFQQYSIEHFGDKALQKAIDFRNRFTLMEGMCFDVDRVSPAIIDGE
jgi:hypothetical protein